MPRLLVVASALLSLLAHGALAQSDPLRSEQWSLDRIRYDEAHAVTGGSPTVVVAIIDSGFDYTHPDLAGAAWINAAEDANGNGHYDPEPYPTGDLDGVDDDGNGYADDVVGYDFARGESDPGPYNGELIGTHGTQVTGILGARVGSGEGIAGVAGGRDGSGGVRLMLLDTGEGIGGGVTSNLDPLIAEALEYAAANGADVINVSKGFSYDSPGVEAAVEAVHTAGIPIIASAGNNGAQQGCEDRRVRYPARDSLVLAVGTVLRSGDRAGISALGLDCGDGVSAVLDVMAPGSASGEPDVDRVPTTDVQGHGDPALDPSEDYTYFINTSAAAPFVAGVAALLLSVNPDLSPEEVYEAIRESADPSKCEEIDPQFTYEEECGQGLVDAYGALVYVIEHFGIRVPPGDTVALATETFEMQPGTGLVVEGDLDATGTTFTAADAGQGWDGIGVYVGGALDFDGVTVSGAVTGVTVRSTGNVFTGSDFEGNDIGIEAGFVCTAPSASGNCLSAYPPQRSSFILDGGTVSNSEVQAGAPLSGIGILARNTDATIRDSQISGNDAFGLYLWNADIGEFTDNAVTGNGTVSGRGGAEILTNGDLRLQGTNPIDPGVDCFTDNADDELWVAFDGFLFVGDATDGGDNAVFDNDLDADTYLVYNEPGKDTIRPIEAFRTFWGTGGAPPSGGVNAGVVTAGPLATNPADCGTGIGRTATTAFGTGSRGADDGAGAARGDRGELRREIRRLRASIAEGHEQEGADALIRALYRLQRRDRADVLGEHAATMALLRAVRQHLGGGALPPRLRAAAEAALTAEVADALRHGDYAEAEALVSDYGGAVTGEDATRSLALLAAMADEAGGRYAEALERVEGVRATLDPEAELRASLELVAERLAAQAGVPIQEGTRGTTAVSGNVQARSEAAENLPAEFVLGAAYPNPARASAGEVTVPLALAEPGDVRVVVYDVLGREVVILHEGHIKEGTHRLTLGVDTLPAGVYVVRAAGGGRAFTQRLTVIR